MKEFRTTGSTDSMRTPQRGFKIGNEADEKRATTGKYYHSAPKYFLGGQT